MSAIEGFRPGDASGGGSPGSSGARMPPVSPQMAFRVAILGGIALVMFGVIFFRLWYLQVLTGERYVQEAAANSVRDLPIAAPRGQIFDREGQPIAASTVTNAVQIVPSALPPAGAPRLRAVPAAGGAARDERRARRGARDQGPHRPALRPGDDQDRRRAGRADRARRAPERVPRRHPAARLDPLLPVRRNGRAGARLCRAGLRTRAEAAPVSGRPAGGRGRSGRAGVLLRPLPARRPTGCSACRSTPKATPCPRACSRRRPRPATASR